MIKKIKKIENFGIYKNFNWDSSIRDDGNNIQEFKKLNIFYGRNYSGKTTLSRIIRAFETKEIPHEYIDSCFEIETDTRNYIQSELQDLNLNIRVYNKDFVDHNLSFLKNEGEEINSFAILGEKNIEIEREIELNLNKLGSQEKKNGLIYELSQTKFNYDTKFKKNNFDRKSLDEKLRNKANQEIKPSLIYGDVNYNITKIKADINKTIKSPKPFFSEEEIVEKKKLLQEQPKDDISELEENFFELERIEQFSKETYDIINKKIKPTESIQDLLDNGALQEWVRNGMLHHREKREKCAFCNNKISNDLWVRLDGHFSQESENIRVEIEKISEKIKKERILKERILKIKKEEFYIRFQSDFEEVKKELITEIKEYNKILDLLIKNLDQRKKDIFKVFELSYFLDNSKKIDQIIKKINILIKDHNSKTTSLKSEQEVIKENLLLDEIANFIKNIDYKNELNRIEGLDKENNKLYKNYEDSASRIKGIEKKIEGLQIQLKDEKKGAEKVNKYLNHFFGHNELKLAAIEEDDGKGFKFKVLRGEKTANNLSEGECSLIAFCYFMAKLKDIESDGKELVIWIDDPISSLDSNHIFFIYSLIESEITKPIKKIGEPNIYRYKQLFLSTHNLDFLKYIKRLSKPKKGGVELFILERNKNETELKLMPKYLKNYVTEFNYLFHQIYKCSTTEITNVDAECFYSFGNNLRKFLEAYLFYKYPTKMEDGVKMKKFFGDDENAIALINRFSNEMSHLEEVFDRSMKPVEIPEINKIAKYIMDKIKEKDEEQYDALIKSIQ